MGKEDKEEKEGGTGKRENGRRERRMRIWGGRKGGKWEWR